MSGRDGNHETQDGVQRPTAHSTFSMLAPVPGRPYYWRVGHATAQAPGKKRSA